jgi:hypothetical protein
MIENRIGKRVRVKDRPEWPSPPGFRLAGAEGTVVKWTDYTDIMIDFQQYVHVKIEKADGEAGGYVGNTFCLRVEDLTDI